MSSMTQKANSNCSYPESDYGDVKSQISRAHEQLMAVLQLEMELRQSLEELFDKQEAEAMEELKKAEKNLSSIREEREAMRSQLKDKRSPTGSHNAFQDPVEEREPPATPLERNFVPTALIGNQQFTSDQEQNSPLPIEDPEAHALSVKYRDNKTALEYHRQLKELELEMEDLRRQVEEIEPIVRRWGETMDKYPLYGEHWRIARNKKQATNYELHKSRLTQLEQDAAVLRVFLASFK